MQKQSIFISYSHKDEDEKDVFSTYMKGANMPGSFKAWSDRDIEIGSKWEAEIFDAINNAKAAVFLISENFLSSDYIMKEEVPLVLKRCQNNQMSFYPILIKPCPWTEHDWLSPTQMLPRDTISLIEMEKKDRLRALNDIVLKIKKLLYPELSNTKNDTITKLPLFHKKPINKKIIKHLTYYNIDRKEQLESIEYYCDKFSQKNPSPRFAWIFHGDDHHCPDKFFELLKEEKLPSYLQQPDVLTIDNINWPQDTENLQLIEKKILRDIQKHISSEMATQPVITLDSTHEHVSNGISLQPEITFETISRQLNEHSGPLLIQCMLYAQQWETNIKNMIDDYINKNNEDNIKDNIKDNIDDKIKKMVEGFIKNNVKNYFKIFEKWPERYKGAFIVVLTIVYLDENKPQKTKKGLFKRLFQKNTYDYCNINIKESFKESLKTIPSETFNYTKTVLFEEFTFIKFLDVKLWAKEPDVKRMDKDDQLIDIMDQLYPNKQNVLPMRDIVKAFRQKLDNQGRQS